MSEERCWILRSKLVSVSRISRKWNVNDWRLNDIIERYHLNTYSKIEDRILKRKDTGKLEPFSYCNKFTGKLYENLGIVDKQGLYFFLDDVQECEKILPHLTCPVPEQTLDDLEAEHGEYIPANEVRKWLNMSPLQFIDMMNAGEGPRSEYEGSLSPDVFARSGYNAWYFNIYDLEAWQEKHSAGQCAREEKAQAPTPSPIGGQSEELEQGNTRVAELEEENKRLQDENERLKQQLAEKAQGQGQDSAQAEALQKVRSELEAEQAAHKKTRAHAVEVLQQAKISKEREITRLQEELARKDAALGQGVDAAQVEELQKELENTKKALNAATKAPAPQAMGTYWLLLHILFLEQGIDCRTIDFSANKTRYATDLEKKIHGIGCTLDDKTIRAKMKEVQAYMDKEKNG